MCYSAHHEIENISNPTGDSKVYNVVGYICETDTFANDRIIPEVRKGDILMCCIFTTLLFFGPRLAFLIYWLIWPTRVYAVLDTWIIPLLGLIFLPWTTLMYVIVA